MPNNTLYTTAEIALVLRCYNDICQGKKPHLTAEEHSFLRNVFVPQNVTIQTTNDEPVIHYRHWAISSRAPYYNVSRREEINRLTQEDYQLYLNIQRVETYQTVDQLRTLIYDGQPTELLVQCVMLEMSYRLQILPKRTSEMMGANLELVRLARELQENGTFNI